MKKTLVALAALASMSAFAQSSVTISGNVDLGMQQTKEKGAQNVWNGDPTVATSKKTTGPIGNGATGFTSSALGLDIKEDLGAGATAGYSAAMNIQSWGAGSDSANQALFTGRHSYAFIGSQKAGEVRLGYQYTLDDQIQGGVGRATPTGNIAGRMQNFSLTTDANVPVVAATTGSVSREGYEVVTSGAITRTNAIQYNTPVYSGIQGMVQYASQGNDQAASNSSADGKANGKVSGAAVKYGNGPLNLGASYMKFTSDFNKYATASTLDQKVDQKLMDLAANYDLGSAKLFGNYFKRKATVAAGSVYNSGADSADKQKSVWGAFSNGGSLDRKGYDLGVSAPVGAWTLYGSVGKATYTINPDGTGSGEAKIKGYTLAAAYDFSKRTKINFYTGQAKSTNTDFEYKKTQTGFGLNHAF